MCSGHRRRISIPRQIVVRTVAQKPRCVLEKILVLFVFGCSPRWHGTNRGAVGIGQALQRRSTATTESLGQFRHVTAGQHGAQKARMQFQTRNKDILQH